MPQKLTQHQNLQIINMYRDGWGPKAIQRKLDSMGNLFGWSTIKDVITKYQRGQIGYSHPDQEPIPAFKGVSDNDIVEIQNEFLNSCTQSSTDIQRKLACKGTHVSTTTVKKAIKVAGFTASKPRYGQMIRDVNKEKGWSFANNYYPQMKHLTISYGPMNAQYNFMITKWLYTDLSTASHIPYRSLNTH